MTEIQDTDNFITELLEATNSDPAGLLQYLHAVQYRYSYIPEVAVRQLASALQLTEAGVRGVIGFYSFLHDSPRGDYDILFSDSITDHMSNSRALLDDLCMRLGVEPGTPREDGRVSVDATSCTGMCDQGPALLVNGRVVTKLDSYRVMNIATLIENRAPLEEWPSEWFRVEDNIRRRDILLSKEPCHGGALKELIEKGADTIFEELEASGLRGRGGAGFNTAMKWKFCREAGGSGEPNDRVVICNADEGEPGTFKDRVLLNSHAGDVFEGMTVCAGIIGARQGFLYLRGEYLYMKPALEETLAKRRRDGLLGHDILGVSGFDFDIQIHMGAGAYICGEESALIESLEGKRGVPRNRPPFPVTHGYLGKPSVVNNVETFLAAAAIAAEGADWFRAVGTGESPGTKLHSISGDCDRPGIYEFPFGVTIQQVLDECGATDVQAVQVAGAAGATIPADEFHRVLAFEDVSSGGSFMVFHKDRDLLDMVQNFARFFVHESCGFCTPCRVGSSLVRDLVDKVHAGQAARYDMEELLKIGAVMKTASHCGLGSTAANCVLDTLHKLPHIYEKRLAQADYEPAFDLDAALQEAREITGRDDAGAHIRTDA